MNKLHNLLFVLLFAITPIGCSEQAAEPDGEIDRYATRGKVMSVAADSDAMTIFHEAIPELADAKGDIVGMDPMQMDLQLGEGVDIAGIAQGDVVSFTLCVQWQPLPGRYWIEDVQKLPADTALDLGKPADDSGHHDHHAHEHEHHHGHAH